MTDWEGEARRPELFVRLLRAKAGELENRVLGRTALDDLDYLTADIALLATLLADHIEQCEERQRNHGPTNWDDWS